MKRFGANAWMAERPNKWRRVNMIIAPAGSILTFCLIKDVGSPLWQLVFLPGAHINRVSYSTTSSARASSVAESSRPNAFAVLTLIASSNLVDCIAGRSREYWSDPAMSAVPRIAAELMHRNDLPLRASGQIAITRFKRVPKHICGNVQGRLAHDRREVLRFWSKAQAEPPTHL